MVERIKIGEKKLLIISFYFSGEVNSQIEKKHLRLGEMGKMENKIKKMMKQGKKMKK